MDTSEGWEINNVGPKIRPKIQKYVIMSIRRYGRRYGGRNLGQPKPKIRGGWQSMVATHDDMYMFLVVLDISCVHDVRAQG